MYRYIYGCYRCPICGKELKTKDYLEEQIVDEIGRKIRDFECCNGKIEFRGTTCIPDVFSPNNKLFILSEKFRNRKV